MFLEIQILALGSRFANSPSANVFSMNGNDLSFLQINVKITNENHRNGIYEEKWHLCDLRKESFTHGAVGRPRAYLAGLPGPSREGPGVGHKIVSDTKQMTKERKRKKEWEKGKNV